MTKGLLKIAAWFAVAAALTIIGNTVFPSGAFAQEKKCSRYCNPDVSKPCGKACISKDFICRKSWTTACVGERPSRAKKGYEKPKHVNEPPNE